MTDATDWGQDADLLAQWCAGNRRAGERLFERHGDAVLRFFRNKVGLQHTEELAQETFVRLISNRDQIRDGRALRSYLLGIARRVLLEYLRKVPRERAFDPDADKIADIVPGASTILARVQEQEIIVNALRHISVDQQILLELYYWEHLKAPKIAKVMNVKLSTMRTRIQLAREALRNAIRELAANPELVESTVADLDDWAEQVRVGYLDDWER